MKPLSHRYGSWALVAGAAEGLGEAFCVQLAGAGFNLILADRDEPLTLSLAERLEREYRVQTITLILDLASDDAANRCLQAAAPVNCRLMLYVAAWSRVARFLDLAREELDAGLATNNRTLIRMVHGFAKKLAVDGQSGGILLVSSFAGLIGPKYVATYAATKSFIIRLAEALHGEFQPLGVDIMACCAGTISTPAYWRSKPVLGKMSPAIMTPEEVAKEALQVFGMKTVYISGWRNRLQYHLLSLLMPRQWASKVVNAAMDSMYGSRV